MHGRQALYYLYTKLVGAGFAYLFFIIFMVIFASMNLFDLSELLASPWLWSAFYGYGIIVSVIIDGVYNVWPHVQKREIYLYIFAGFVIFLILMTQWVYIIIAGSIGIGAALLFYIGVKVVTKNKWTSFIFGILIPILLVVVSYTDFTKKENWHVIESDSRFEANYTYFDGEHKIPFKLNKGDVLTYKVDFSKKHGGWGMHLEDAKGKYQLQEEKRDWLTFTAETDGTYHIVIRGHQANGRFVVNWDIAQ